MTSLALNASMVADLLWRVAYRSPGGGNADWFFVYLHLEHRS